MTHDGLALVILPRHKVESYTLSPLHGQGTWLWLCSLPFVTRRQEPRGGDKACAALWEKCI